MEKLPTGKKKHVPIRLAGVEKKKYHSRPYVFSNAWLTAAICLTVVLNRT